MIAHVKRWEHSRGYSAETFEWTETLDELRERIKMPDLDPTQAHVATYGPDILGNEAVETYRWEPA